MIPKPTDDDLKVNWRESYTELTDERISAMMPDFQADAMFQATLIRLLAASEERCAELAKENERLQAERDQLKAKLAEAEAVLLTPQEMDAFLRLREFCQHKSTTKGYCCKCGFDTEAYCRETPTSRRKIIERLQAADKLAEFAGHNIGCPNKYDSVMNCTCGYIKALTTYNSLK